jgi:hypothetical protein
VKGSGKYPRLYVARAAAHMRASKRTPTPTAGSPMPISNDTQRVTTARSCRPRDASGATPTPTRSTDWSSGEGPPNTPSHGRLTQLHMMTTSIDTAGTPGDSARLSTTVAPLPSAAKS